MPRRNDCWNQWHARWAVIRTRIEMLRPLSRSLFLPTCLPVTSTRIAPRPWRMTWRCSCGMASTRGSRLSLLIVKGRFHWSISAISAWRPRQQELTDARWMDISEGRGEDSPCRAHGSNTRLQWPRSCCSACPKMFDEWVLIERLRSGEGDFGRRGGTFRKEGNAIGLACSHLFEGL